MSRTPHSVEVREPLTARGHAIGSFETQIACEALMLALYQAEFPEAQITVFHGEEGIRRLESMLEGSLRGESAEEVVNQGAMELRDGQTVVCVEVQDAVEAAGVAAVLAQHGGYRIYYSDYQSIRS